MPARFLLLSVSLAAAACLPAEVRQVRPTVLDDGLVFVRGGGGNSLVLARAGRALVFDAKTWPWDGAVREALRTQGASADYIVDSHAHFDHAQAAAYYEGALVLAAPYTAARLAEGALAPAFPRPAGVPSLAVRTRLSLSVGGEPAVVVALPPGHTAGDVALWLPRRRVLATGDAFDAGYYPHVDPGLGGTMNGYLAALDRLAAFDAVTVLPGHGPAATRADLLAYRDWLRSVRDAVRRARVQGLTDATIVETLRGRAAEPYEDLGVFSSRRGVIEAFVREPETNG